MKTVVITVLVSLTLLGCASSPSADNSGKSNSAERNANATSLTVDLNSDPRHVLATVPPESAMERFEMLDVQGRSISYVALTDTDVGGVVFVDKKLLGTVSKHIAQAFYSCRGYATATQSHWAREASAWAESLMEATTSATTVTLNFSGKSTTQSIKEVVADQTMSDVGSLVNMGTNPFSIFRTLNSTRDNAVEHRLYEKTLSGLRSLHPGASEAQVAEIVRPEDVSFVSGGLVMAYPRYSVEYYVSDGVVKVIQQPSFYQLSRVHAALFYAPNAQWAQCTPQGWKTALQDVKAEAGTAAK